MFNSIINQREVGGAGKLGRIIGEFQCIESSQRFCLIFISISGYLVNFKRGNGREIFVKVLYWLRTRNMSEETFCKNLILLFTFFEDIQFINRELKDAVTGGLKASTEMFVAFK